MDAGPAKLIGTDLGDKAYSLRTSADDGWITGLAIVGWHEIEQEWYWDADALSWYGNPANEFHSSGTTVSRAVAMAAARGSLEYFRTKVAEGVAID